ncbi:Aste57867_15810 [Aphanomyces stellatus]|uniref:Fanconi-associated nuclease n=1 Tax=Aphanomyces stellatus TaxID=120398 RepID=A0A485L402_9STRA|nr:hypothetical protein As57867_015754 [Aphanomyces stellatus]VFT92598.1 Aste57867_15810 [Aphanomyces stellatus]
MADEAPRDDEGVAEPKEQSNAYVEHFVHILTSTQSHFNALLTPADAHRIETFLALPYAAQAIYARLFQRKGPWFRTSSLASAAERIGAATVDARPALVQDALQSLASNELISFCPTESTAFPAVLDAMSRACTTPEIQAVLHAIGATTSKSSGRYKTKGDILQRLRSFVSTQRRIDGSYLPLSKHLMAVLNPLKTNEIHLFQLHLPTRDAFYRMHRLMYVTTPPIARPSAARTFGSWAEWQTATTAYEPTPWPGLLTSFGHVTFQAVECSLGASSLFPSMAALVAYQCAGMLRRSLGLVTEALAMDLIPTAQPELSVDWLDHLPPTLHVFGDNDATTPSPEDCFANVEHFLRGVATLDDLVVEVRHCLRQQLHAPTTAATRVFFEPYQAAYGLARCLDMAVALYEKLGQHDKALVLLQELLATSLLRHKRGGWYSRLAINLEQHLKQPQEARTVCEQALSDPHLYPADRKALLRRHRRLVKRALKKVESRTNDDDDDDEVTWPIIAIDGRPLNRAMGEKSRFIGYDDAGCTVEELVLQYYGQQGWHGVHDEGALLRMLFGLLLWEIIFMDISDVFQTPFQDRPLDMDMRYANHFYSARATAIDATLAKLRDATPHDLCSWIHMTWQAHDGKLGAHAQWDRYSLASVQLLAVGLGARQLANLLSVWVKHLDTGGLPDLTVMRVTWRSNAEENESDKGDITAFLDAERHVDITNWLASAPTAAATTAAMDHILTQTVEAQFVEVKGPRDRLSDTQMVWLERLNGAGMHASVCYVQEPTKKEPKAIKKTPQKKPPTKTSRPAKRSKKALPPPPSTQPSSPSRATSKPSPTVIYIDDSDED